MNDYLLGLTLYLAALLVACCFFIWRERTAAKKAREGKEG